MSIIATSQSLIGLLKENYFKDHNGQLDGLSFSSITTNQLNQNLSNQVSLFLYRIDVDRTKRHKDIHHSDQNSPPKQSLALELHYLLTVWADTPERQQSTLAYCMQVLDKYSILSGEFLHNLDPINEFQDGTELKIQLESITNEDMLRLWDSVESSYQLSLSYLVRTILLEPVVQDQAAIVKSKSNIWLSKGVSHDC